MPHFKLLALIPFLVICCQIYNYAVIQKKEERQKVCFTLGIISFTIGIVSLISRDSLFVFAGLILMMFGFRLIAHGLDRPDKKNFIDRYQPPPD